MFQAMGLAAVCAALGGLTPAGDPPGDQEVLRALPQAKGVPYVLEMSRDDVVIVKDRVVSREFVLDVLGLDATVVSTHWKCTVYYAETVESSYPFPYRLTKNRAQVVYIDKTGMK